ncbi:Transcription factor lhw [Thalictrum thalictroides]|uniref:Transcription factor lhw n=1 Tax=Thalictrum thalictroides TaxID=46969 RepID=A0A7J6WDF0_THATH|nr:Transcription factor lhw [Thalictrum thalictroides]
MGTLLKEALKCLCGANRWSYAIFWKIGYQNPTLLVWEDFHYEPTHNSSLSSIAGVDSTDLLLKEWEGLWSYHENHFPQYKGQGEDRVSSLLNRMMINNHVHVVGEGWATFILLLDFHSPHPS